MPKLTVSPFPPPHLTVLQSLYYHCRPISIIAFSINSGLWWQFLRWDGAWDSHQEFIRVNRLMSSPCTNTKRGLTPTFLQWTYNQFLTLLFPPSIPFRPLREWSSPKGGLVPSTSTTQHQFPGFHLNVAKCCGGSKLLSVKLNMMRHVRAFKRALNHLSHLHTFPTVWQMVQDVSFLKVSCRLPGTTCDSASFLQTGFLPTYTPGRQWNNFNSLSLWDMESSGNFQERITA